MLVISSGTVCSGIAITWLVFESPSQKMFYFKFLPPFQVHRGPNYVTTLRFYSSRTHNTECLNSQNPYGFHLSDGTTYTYIIGNEYEDIAGAWDWNMVPGITVDYNATLLQCSTVNAVGMDPFVGGVSTGKIGIGVMVSYYDRPSSKLAITNYPVFFLLLLSGTLIP